MKRFLRFLYKDDGRKVRVCGIKVCRRTAKPNYPKIENPKLIMTLLVKNEIDIIEQNLLFHRAMGVDGFIVTDNISTDGTREVLETYKDKGWILDIIDEPAQDYSQSDWVHRMVIQARDQYKADWIMNVDADEFWYSKSGNLKNEIRTSPENILFVPISNMLDLGRAWIDNTDMIVGFIPPKRAEKLMAEGKLSKFHMFSRQGQKVIVRASEYVHIHMGNHKADMVINHEKSISKDIMIYHYSSRGRERFKLKMLQGGAAFERNMKLGKKAGNHWRYFWEGYKDGTLNMDSEYDKSVGKDCPEEYAKLLVKDDTIKRFFNGA